jgi:hypothetical protein
MGPANGRHRRNIKDDLFWVQSSNDPADDVRQYFLGYWSESRRLHACYQMDNLLRPVILAHDFSSTCAQRLYQ